MPPWDFIPGAVVRDSAAVCDVLFSNLVIECNRKHFNWWGDGDPIRFVVLKRNSASRLGSIRGVVVSNVIARGQGTSLIADYEGEGKIENISPRGVHLTIESEATPDKRATHGIILRDLKDVTLDDLRVTWEQMWASDQDLAPDNMELEDKYEEAPVPVPGVYKFA